ncbi:UDP-N-acetylmuramoyl-tripeptide--D-alanyl-D-alanine ligase [Oleiagrimonas sp. C23AA]|uniref:UDP-N-acetylmuramoyl-tripeptide--D-alanyl-D- alanine ligase n=1 Tax=Oleiagrimonas sp. C23AA TaxID=2719047 RepID=UPI0014245DFA|nr:UDP-N-acetylmuramoyl-tripeptide--D-alanyl-D-alanine ligase [Oleiagrimonas sp. C23AA]NII09901.1 UDP-N-acetylmuramoyl-tripeptide--D-alanyl-D-alanine ligase [Oleiagrimonas sp. C23AA]
MLNLRLSEIALWTHGQLMGTDGAVNGVSTDTRSMERGALFVALKGEHHDGHDHLAAAAEAGAVGALVDHRIDINLPQVVVSDTLAALGDLASAVRAKRRARVIGITGSNGKTTVKTLTAAILSRHGRTHVNAGNFNNEIGLPLTLLAMPEDAEYAVLEMGAGKPGDIDYLAAIARPDIGLVNTIAPAHLERMGTLEMVAETKGAVYQALPSDGIAVINADDDFAGFFAGLAGARTTLRFGLSAPADISAEILSLDTTGSRFVLRTPQGEVAVALPLPGRHNVANALAAASIACALDVPLATIAEGLQHAGGVPGRLRSRAMSGGWTLIDDSYNANPASTNAAIDTLALAGGERYLVLGDMAELGPNAEALHAEVGARARERGLQRLYATGPLSAAAVRAFGEGARHFDSREALLAALHADLHAGVTCLVKGSRSSAMDRVVSALETHSGGDAHHVA